MSERRVNIQALRMSITMEDALRHYKLLDGMKPNGDQLWGCCPIHKGSNPTQFRVNPVKNTWFCHSTCKHGGDVLLLIMRIEDMNYDKATRKAIEWFNLDPDKIYYEK